MGKYVDSEKLIAEIERRKNQTERRIDNIVSIRRKDTVDEEQLAKIELRDKVDKAYLNGVLITLSDILSSVTSLQQEQPEVDLEKEIKDKYSQDTSTLKTRAQYTKLAQYFYELGLNARKVWNGGDIYLMKDYPRGVDCSRLVSLAPHIAKGKSCTRKRFSAMIERKKQRKLLSE